MELGGYIVWLALALTAMRYRPETIRSMVLDSAVPLQSNFMV
jgi:hypothetical protein